MHAKSIRLTDDMLRGISLVEDREHIDGSAAIRKLIRTGLEAYVAGLYRDGALTLREAAARLDMDLIEALDRLADHGVKGNLEAADVLASIERFA
jgi:Arc/MetJ-type ribon-helix-helix transcriptional regulator